MAESRSFRGRLYEQGPSPMDGLGAIGKSNNRGSKSRHLSCGSPFMSGDVISGQDPPPGGTRENRGSQSLRHPRPPRKASPVSLLPLWVRFGF